MRIAIVHDFFVYAGGAERVVFELKKIFSDADVWTLFIHPDFKESTSNKFNFISETRTSFLNKFPNFLKRHYRWLLLFLPWAVESLDLRDYDLIISSGYWTKGIITRVNSIHINYCHAPTRFLWDYSFDYFKEPNFKGGIFTKFLFHLLRLWDRQAAERVDYYIANSNWTKERLKKFYQKDSEVIYPPVSMLLNENKCLKTNFIKNSFFKTEKYFLIVSRLVPYKKIDIAIKAFNKLNLPLVIIGDGPDKKRLEKLIISKKIKLIGRISDEELSEYYKNCFVYIQPNKEDFGISMVEALMCGKPVLSLRSGGALEIIEEGFNGEFFDDPTMEVLADGVRRICENYKNYNNELIRQSAQKFSVDNFKKAIQKFVESKSLNLN